MERLSRILVAVDFSSPARRGFEYALALATRHGADLVAIQAVPPNQAFNWEGTERQTLKASLQQAADEAAVGFDYRVQHGDAAEIILLHAHALRPDVIVVGTHQRRGLERWRLGSVSERVVTKASVPVLVVPASLRAQGTGTFRHVAVAVDLTAVSEAAVERALDVASDGTHRVTLLHAMPGLSSRVPPSLYSYGMAQQQSQDVREARRELQLAVPAERPIRAAIHTRILRGDTTTQISRAAGTIGADLLVVGVPRRGVVANALFGTTASRLLKVSRVPVLAVPAARQRSRRKESVPQPRGAERGSDRATPFRDMADAGLLSRRWSPR